MTAKKLIPGNCPDWLNPKAFNLINRVNKGKNELDSKKVRLYAWQPKNDAEFSFFVMAESEEDAASAVKKYIEDSIVCDEEDELWSTKSHNLKIFEIGQVLEVQTDRLIYV